MNTKSVTLQDIASQLKVSVVTISKALRGHPDISAQTIQKVKQLAQDMGYSPNYLARSLSSKKTRTIGLVIPKIAHFFFSSVVEAIYDAAFQNNYEIILTVSQENAEREMIHIQTLLSMRVDGIITSITQETKDYSIFERVKRMGIPLIFIDRFPPLSGFSTISVDDRGGAFRAVEHAIKIGYTRIGHIAGYAGINISDGRYQGFVEAMNKYNISINQDWILHGGFAEKDGYQAFMKLYDTGNIPDFLFTVTYPVALGVYKAAREVNLHIPEDVDIICFGNSDIQQYIHPPLSCVDQPTRELGEVSFELMLKIIHDPESFQEQHIVLPTELIIRNTCNMEKQIHPQFHTAKD